jgi:hypothetical protein
MCMFLWLQNSSQNEISKPYISARLGKMLVIFYEYGFLVLYQWQAQNYKADYLFRSYFCVADTKFCVLSVEYSRWSDRGRVCFDVWPWRLKYCHKNASFFNTNKGFSFWFHVVHQTYGQKGQSSPHHMPWRHREGGRYRPTLLFIIGVECTWVVNTTPRLLYLRERHGAYYIGGLVRSKAGLDRWGNFRPHRDSIPGPSNPYIWCNMEILIIQIVMFTIKKWITDREQ